MKNRSPDSVYVRSDQYIEDRDYIVAARKELAVSINRLAAAANVSPAALSQALSGKYPSCPKQIFDATLSALDNLKATRAYNGSMPFMKTSVVRQVKATCDEAFAIRHTDSIGLLTGNVGVGKTTALKRYCAETNHAIYIRASTGMSKSSMLSDLSGILGGIKRTGTIADRQAAIANFLRNNPRLIVLDEAYKATRQALEALRDIVDDAESGLVLAGREMLYDRLASNHGEYAEIASRIITWNTPINALTEDDIYLILNQSEVSKDLDNETKEIIFQCSESNGRVLQHLMQKLFSWRNNMRAQKKDHVITSQVVSEIYHAVIVPMSAAWRRN